VHVADGLAAQRAGKGWQQAVRTVGGHSVRRLAARPEQRARPEGPDGVVRQVENGPVPADQGERDQVQGGGSDDRRQAQAVPGTRRRRFAGQRAQHVQFAGGLGDEPVRRPGDVRVFRPGRRRPGGEAPGQDHHQHQPHTVDVRHHAADQRRRGEPEDDRRESDLVVGPGRLRRVRDAGALRDTRTGDARRRTTGTGAVQGVRALGRVARRRHVGTAEAGGRPGNAERRGPSHIHVGQLEAPEEDAHGQHVRTRTVRERQRPVVARQRPQKHRFVTSTHPQTFPACRPRAIKIIIIRYCVTRTARTAYYLDSMHDYYSFTRNVTRTENLKLYYRLSSELYRTYRYGCNFSSDRIQPCVCMCIFC